MPMNMDVGAESLASAKVRVEPDAAYVRHQLLEWLRDAIVGAIDKNRGAELIKMEKNNKAIFVSLSELEIALSRISKYNDFFVVPDKQATLPWYGFDFDNTKKTESLIKEIAELVDKIMDSQLGTDALDALRAALADQTHAAFEKALSSLRLGKAKPMTAIIRDASCGLNPGRGEPAAYVLATRETIRYASPEDPEEAASFDGDRLFLASIGGQAPASLAKEPSVATELLRNALLTHAASHTRIAFGIELIRRLAFEYATPERIGKLGVSREDLGLFRKYARALTEIVSFANAATSDEVDTYRTMICRAQGRLVDTMSKMPFMLVPGHDTISARRVDKNQRHGLVTWTVRGNNAIRNEDGLGQDIKDAIAWARDMVARASVDPELRIGEEVFERKISLRSFPYQTWAARKRTMAYFNGVEGGPGTDRNDAFVLAMLHLAVWMTTPGEARTSRERMDPRSLLLIDIEAIREAVEKDDIYKAFSAIHGGWRLFLEDPARVVRFWRDTHVAVEVGRTLLTDALRTAAREPMDAHPLLAAGGRADSVWFAALSSHPNLNEARSGIDITDFFRRLSVFEDGAVDRQAMRDHRAFRRDLETCHRVEAVYGMERPAEIRIENDQSAAGRPTTVRLTRDPETLALPFFLDNFEDKDSKRTCEDASTRKKISDFVNSLNICVYISSNIRDKEGGRHEGMGVAAGDAALIAAKTCFLAILQHRLLWRLLGNGFDRVERVVTPLLRFHGQRRDPTLRLLSEAMERGDRALGRWIGQGFDCVARENHKHRLQAVAGSLLTAFPVRVSRGDDDDDVSTAQSATRRFAILYVGDIGGAARRFVSYRYYGGTLDGQGRISWLGLRRMGGQGLARAVGRAAYDTEDLRALARGCLDLIENDPLLRAPLENVYVIASVNPKGGSGIGEPILRIFAELDEDGFRRKDPSPVILPLAARDIKTIVEAPPGRHAAVMYRIAHDIPRVFGAPAGMDDEWSRVYEPLFALANFVRVRERETSLQSTIILHSLYTNGEASSRLIERRARTQADRALHDALCLVGFLESERLVGDGSIPGIRKAFQRTGQDETKHINAGNIEFRPTPSNARKAMFCYPALFSKTAGILEHLFGRPGANPVDGESCQTP